MTFASTDYCCVADARTILSTAMIYLVNWEKPFPAPLNEQLLQPLVQTGLKFITVGGAGYDRVDIDYLTSNGVIYANNPRTVMHRTADSTAMMILMACKAATQQERSLRDGKWANRTLKAKNPRGLTLGIVGMGNIGSIGRISFLSVAQRGLGTDPH